MKKRSHLPTFTAVVLIAILTVTACPDAGIEPKILNAPESLTPSDGTRTENTTPEFRWNAVEKATGYEWQIAQSGKSLVEAELQTIGTTSHTPNTALALAKYYWRVRAIFEDGTRGKWTAIMNLELFVSTSIKTYNFANYTNLSLRRGIKAKSEAASISGLVNGKDVSYSIAKPDEVSDENADEVTIDPSTGIVTIAADAPGLASGTYTVIATGKGNYADSITASIIIDIPYAIGGKGPAGGTIFYDKGNYDDDWRYLETAPADLPGGMIYKWGDYFSPLSTSTAIGSGKNNTKLIVEDHSFEEEIECAAKACFNYIVNGYDDWFLPSRDELEALCNQRYEVPGLDFSEDSWYWSSSSVDSGYAWIRYFSHDAHQVKLFKLKERNARAIRSF